MSNNFQNEVDIAAVVDCYVYLDIQELQFSGMSLGSIVEELEHEMPPDNANFNAIKEAIENDPTGKISKLELVSQSSINTDIPKTKLVACTFSSADGTDYYVAYRGTGDGKWLDNGEGMYEPATVMQREAARYFDDVVETKNLSSAHNIIVTGHSKGGNSAQFVALASDHYNLVDTCYSFEGQGFSDEAIKEFKNRLGEDAYQAQLDKMYSINGENDPVHELGRVVISRDADRTFYVKKSISGAEGMHNMNAMLINGSVDLENNIDPGPVTLFARKLSNEMMSLKGEDLRDCALSVMSLIERYAFGGESYIEGTGNVKFASVEEFCGFISVGIPLILKTAVTTEEGRAAVGSLAMEMIDGVAASENGGWKLAAGTALVLVCAPAIIGVGATIWAGATIIDGAADLINGDFTMSDVPNAMLAATIIAHAATFLIAYPGIVIAVLTVVAVIALVTFIVNNWDSIKAFINGVGDFAVGIMTAIYAWAENLVTQAMTILKSAIGKAVDLYRGAKQAIIDFGNKLMSSAMSFYNKMSDNIICFLNSIGSWVKGLFGNGSSALAYGSQIVVTTSYIENLQRRIRDLREKYIDINTCIISTDGVITSVYSYYNESYVRSCCRDVQNELKNAQKYISTVERALDKKRIVLSTAIENYRRADQNSMKDIRNFSFSFC